jgi:hypothetical protein
MVTEEHASGNILTLTEALPTEGDEAPSGSDEGDVYVQPKKIPQPKRVKGKPKTKQKVCRDCMPQLEIACLMQNIYTSYPRPSATELPPSKPTKQ